MSAFLTVAIVHLLGAMSPGPDFAMVLKNSLVYGRKGGVWTALGIASGILVHVSYCMLGIGVLITQSILLFNAVKMVGAAYLMYIGIKALFAKKALSAGPIAREHKSISPREAVKQGFLCNVLNPKATVFFLALFTQVIDPATSLPVLLFYSAFITCTTFLWFGFVAVILSVGGIQRAFRSVQQTIERIMGAVLFALGLRIALTARE